ncbi:trehalase [Platysternon megacephalum]|uniref:Trehalase n=1 Tax=Platysternon megacephalum TaxID=55544 RepID=A0A4D9DSA2_9SAUR|nr:trehalase [Platysternon megacephalum]
MDGAKLSRPETAKGQYGPRGPCLARTVTRCWSLSAGDRRTPEPQDTRPRPGSRRGSCEAFSELAPLRISQDHRSLPLSQVGEARLDRWPPCPEPAHGGSVRGTSEAGRLNRWKRRRCFQPLRDIRSDALSGEPASPGQTGSARHLSLAGSRERIALGPSASGSPPAIG